MIASNNMATVTAVMEGNSKEEMDAKAIKEDEVSASTHDCETVLVQKRNLAYSIDDHGWSRCPTTPNDDNIVHSS